VEDGREFGQLGQTLMVKKQVEASQIKVKLTNVL